MPATSEKQRRFMWLVHGLQKGKLSSKKVGSKASKAAHSMNQNDVKDFLMESCGLKKCDVETKRRLLGKLKELQTLKSYSIREDDEQESINPIASTKTFHGDFDSTVKMYRGFELTSKENQAIQNFTDFQPTAHDKFKVQYSKSDDYGNTSTFVVKKLQDQGHFVYIAIMKSRAGEETPAGSTPPEKPEGDKGPPDDKSDEKPQLKEEMNEEIKIVKSIPIDDNEGSEILTNFLQTIYRTLA